MFAELITRIAAFLGLATSNENILEGLSECRKGVRRLNKALKTAKTLGERQHIESCLRNIKSLRNQLKIAQKKGSGARKETAWDRVRWDDVNSTFQGRVRTGVITNLKQKDPRQFLIDAEAIFRRRIQNALKKDPSLKVNAVFCGEFVVTKGDHIKTEYKYFTTCNSPIYKDTNLKNWFNKKVVAPILTELEEFQERDSGWALRKVVNLGVNINKFTPQLGSSYIPLPDVIARKKACVNVKNDDEACFAWAVVSALYPAEKNPQRLSNYPHYSTVLKLKGIQFPMNLKQIPNFEKQNEISINVYIIEKSKVLPIYLMKEERGQHVNLLMINNEVGEHHFLWIKNLSRLVSSQLSKENHQKFFCNRCLHYFRTEDRLKTHMEECARINETKIKMPEEGSTLKFKDHKNKIKTPFIVYADLESVLKPESNKIRHLPAAVGYYFKCSYDDTFSYYRSYRGENCMEWFSNEMASLAEDLSTVFWCPYDIDMTMEQENEFQNAKCCHICEEALGDDKVRDHDHLLPENNYRGAAHPGCNVNFKDSHTVPVVFHNLSGYDAHFIIKDIASKIQGKIDLLPITKERYISFTKHLYEEPIKFRFIDSFRFMNSPLDDLASYLSKFPILTSQYPESTDLLTAKGIMPYEYIDSFARFDETALPPIKAFYSKLTDTECSEDRYQRAHQIWNTFNCQTLGDYVDLYMKTDILLLADVFEQFRDSCHQTYSLDPAHYFTLPGYTWSCMLKHTKQELELLSDPDMFLFIEKGIRGGLSQVCAKRRSHANNKYLSNFDPSKPPKYLMYDDVNNQYGWAMSQFLPYGGFEWCDAVDVMQLPDDSPIGYMLEVDLEYPRHLHDAHKDIPFCCEHINPKTGKPPRRPSEQRKLMATLHGKEKYVIHYRALKQALENGLVLKKVHRVLKFKQSAWLKSYIDLNTQLRQNAKNDFEKNLFKLMNNAVFGKTMENIRKRVNVRLLTEWSGRYGAETMISKPEFKTSTIFDENLIAVELKQLEICLNKPIYVGQTILDLAKTTIYDFHYGYMVQTFPGCIALYTDTDSVIYELQQDPYPIINRDCHKYFDTSDYPADNIYGIPQVNKKVLGMMKDENNGVPMSDFIGLRSKMYALRVDGKEKVKKAKGIKKHIVKNVITFDDYVNCLESGKEKIIQQQLFQSDKHLVYTVDMEKIALSSDDDKRYILEDGINTLPWGHYAINKRKMECESKTSKKTKVL